MADTPSAGSAAEVVLCDTSFVSVLLSSARNDIVARWPAATRVRLDAATLAISAVSLAELRSGHIKAGWGDRRRADAERFISAYLRLPLDMAVVDEWAQVAADCQRNGFSIPHNDIWIAATAISRGLTLVSCDHHFDHIATLDHIYLDRI